MKTFLLIAFLFLSAFSLSHAASTATVIPGQTVLFTVTADGTAPFTYQWMKNGVPISGATGGSLTLAAIGPSDAGTYTVQVSNSAGSALSDSAVIFTVTAPSNAKITIKVT